jgi:hypothetical protein
MMWSATNITVAAAPICQKPDATHAGDPRGNTDPNADSSHFPITRFHIHIDRVSVSHHGTALLIFGAIPILIGH